MKSNPKVPTYDRLMNPLLQAIRDLGGSASIEELYQKVSENLQLPEEVLSILHNQETGNQTEVGYRLAWARTYLKKYGILENSVRGILTISPKGSLINDVDPKADARVVQMLCKPP